ncbi:unnamed protein product [Nippostrongylus brasiliensis]|uniref:Uncharacterized protein n=1 Tax=Nippostrongylus brasiliensis TaxID=27835 RepID=A0A0N4XVK3_NIPBR|nr:unnamed protein product [Nippostrongylus brasiliensis]
MGVNARAPVGKPATPPMPKQRLLAATSLLTRRRRPHNHNEAEAEARSKDADEVAAVAVARQSNICTDV